MAAVPFDHGQNSSTTGSGSMSFAAGASATVAVIYIRTDGTSPSVTYGGVAMSLVKTALALNGDENYYAFYLAGITAGTQTVAWTIGGSPSNTQVLGLTYTGGPYSSTPDCVAQGAVPNGSGGSGLSITLTTTQTNVIGTSHAVNGGVAFAATSGMTIRTSTSVANSVEDSTNLIAATGAFNMTWANSGGNATNIQGLAVGIGLAPAGPANVKTFDGVTQSTGIKTYLGVALASVKKVDGIA